MRRDAPGLCSPTTRVALTRLAEAGKLPPDDAAMLIHADHVWRTLQGMLRITVGRGARGELPDASALALLRAVAGSAVDLETLQATLDDLAQQVRAMFVRHIGEIRT